MRIVILVTLVLSSVCHTMAQSPSTYFHNASKLYIDGNSRAAKNIVTEGISKFPNDKQLNALNKVIKEEDQENQNQQDQDQQNQDQQDQEQQNQDQQNQDQQNQEQQNREDEGEQKDQEGEQDQKDQKEGDQEQEQQQNEEGQEGEKNEQQPNMNPGDQMQEMKISEEKARMILEALKNNEVQYIQQNRRKPTKRKDSDKPDW